MKKLIALLLAAVMAFGLFGCGGSDTETAATGESKRATEPTQATEPAAPEGLQVGYGKVDITPMGETVHLQGGDWKSRISSGLLDQQFVTCIAIREGDQTVLLYTMDFKVATDNFVDPAKTFVSAATGVPEENILMNATHTHAATAIRYNWDGVEAYRTKFNEASVKAAEQAIKDLSSAKILAGSTMTEGMTFVRHYVDANGNVVLRSSPDVAAHYREPDPEMQLVKFQRDSGKDVLLISFPTHATFNEGGTDLSADFPSPMRDYIEQNSDCLVAYFMGAAGDQTPGSRAPGVKTIKDYRKYGETLGDYALQALPTLTEVAGEEIELLAKKFTAPTNKKNVDKLVQANTVVQLAEQYGRNSTEVTNALAEYGFAQYLEASWTITRSRLEETMSMELKVLRVGDLSFVLAPYEMFGHHGTDIKTQSPFDNTFIITCAEGSWNYIASSESFEFNAYESYCCYFAQGTAEKLVEEYVGMLTELKN